MIDIQEYSSFGSLSVFGKGGGNSGLSPWVTWGILFIVQLGLYGPGEQSLVLELAVIFADQIVLWLADCFSVASVGELYDTSVTYYFLFFF